MTTPKQIKAQIRDLRREMKANGIRIVCTMNRLDTETFRYNAQLERLKLELERAQREG